MRIIIYLLICICIVCRCWSKGIVHTISSLNDNNTTEVSERIFRRVDFIENEVRRIWTFSNQHTHLMKSLFGALILFYGGEFSNTIVFTQALMITGWPIISKYASTLYKSYKLNRDTLRKELPDIIKAEADVADLVLAIESDYRLLKDLDKQFSSKKISQAEYTAQANIIRKRISKSKYLVNKTRAIQNSIDHLKHSLHIDHLKVTILILC